MFAGLIAGLKQLFVISSVAMLADTLLEGRKSSLSGAVRLVSALCTVFCVFSAFFCVFSNADAQGFHLVEKQPILTELAENEVLLELTRKETEKQLEENIFSLYGIKPEQVSIQFNIHHTRERTEVSVLSASIVLDASVNESLCLGINSYAKSVLGTDDVKTSVKTKE